MPDEGIAHRVSAIQALVGSGQYVLSIHAEKERQADKIAMEELEEALQDCRVIEDYPEDPRGPSCLVLGWAKHRPIHAVCAIKQEPLITIYDPSRRPEKWIDNYQRRRRS